jgi:hypothetical protein
VDIRIKYKNTRDNTGLEMSIKTAIKKKDMNISQLTQFTV